MNKHQTPSASRIADSCWTGVNLTNGSHNVENSSCRSFSFLLLDHSQSILQEYNMDVQLKVPCAVVTVNPDTEMKDHEDNSSTVERRRH